MEIPLRLRPRRAVIPESPAQSTRFWCSARLAVGRSVIGFLQIN